MHTLHNLPNSSPDLSIPKLIISPFKKKLYKFYQFFGLSLTSFAIAMIIYSYSADISSASDLKLQESPKSPAPAVQLENSNKAKPVAKGYEVADEANSYGVGSSFAVVIPKIKAYSNIIPDVSVSNKSEYMDALKQGVAHAKGTSHPGEGSTIYLFSHSTDSTINIRRYNAVFYDLKKLELGDEIIIYHSHQKYIYKVSQKEVVSPKDTSWLAPRETETLILQTCDPPGTTWKRLLILAKPI